MEFFLPWPSVKVNVDLLTTLYNSSKRVLTALAVFTPGQICTVINIILLRDNLLCASISRVKSGWSERSVFCREPGLQGFEFASGLALKTSVRDWLMRRCIFSGMRSCVSQTCAYVEAKEPCENGYAIEFHS